MRAAALAVIETLLPAERVRLAAPSLRDAVRAVRLAAAHALAGAAQALSPCSRPTSNGRWRNLVAAETVNADQPEATLNLANLYVRLGCTAEAKSELQSALVLDPRFCSRPGQPGRSLPGSGA